MTYLEIGPCGGYNATYFSLCNYFGLPSDFTFHKAIAWYMENLYTKRDRIFDIKKLYLNEYDIPDIEL